MEKGFFVLRVCDFIAKYCLYALIFLMPLFFLPWTTEVLDFNKQALLFLLVALCLFVTMSKILLLGRFEINKSPIHIVAAVLFLIYLLATIFSVYRYGSFWGQSQQTSESMLTLGCLLLFYFLTSNVFSGPKGFFNIFTSVVILSVSAIVAEIIGILQLFGVFLLPLVFTKSILFNTVGSAGSLGLFAAILLPLAIALAIISKKWQRVLFFAQIIISALIIILINYPIIWWVVLAGSASFLILGIMKRDIFDARWMALPMFFLAVSLFFILLNGQVNWLPQKPNEIFVSQEASFNIVLQTLKERPFFGSGPGTFKYDFSKFKNPDFGNTALWNIAFNNASSKILTSLATLGILGFLALLAFLATPVFVAVKFFVKGGVSEEFVPKNKTLPVLLAGLCAALAAQVLSFFLYNSSAVLDFIFFFAVAAVVVITSQSRKEYILKPSSLLALAVTFVFTLVFIFCLGILIINSQKYLAEVKFYKALVAYQSGQKADGLKKLEEAARLNMQSDTYLKQLSRAYLLSLQEELRNAPQNPTDEQKAKAQALLANSVNAAKIATDLNPQDASNWSLRGFVYQSLIGIFSDAPIWAINSYDEALKLDPNNPYLFAQEGNVNFANALSQSADQSEQKRELLEKAQVQLEKAVGLNPNYSNALYSLGLVYDQLGQKSKAIEAFIKVQRLNPQDTDIGKILDNLNAGRSAFQAVAPQVENPPSGTPNKVENPPSK